jgi:predicted nucleotidyltransferase
MKKTVGQMDRDDILEVLRRFKEVNSDRYKIARLGLFGSGAKDKRREK